MYKTFSIILSREHATSLTKYIYMHIFNQANVHANVLSDLVPSRSHGFIALIKSPQ